MHSHQMMRISEIIPNPCTIIVHIDTTSNPWAMWGKKPSILQMSCNRHYWKSRAHCRVEYEFIIHNKTIRFSYTLCIYKNSHCSVKKKVVINLNILKDKPEMLQLLGVTWAFKPGIHDIYYTEDILSFYHCYHIL